MGFKTSNILKLFNLIIIMTIPTPLYACGTCVDMTIRFYLPFIIYTIPLFIIWLFVRHRTVQKTGVKSFVFYVILYILLSIFSLGSILFPYLFFFIWWIFSSFQAIVLSKSKSSWRSFNKFIIPIFLYLVFVTVFAMHNYPEKVIKFVEYKGGPYSEAVERIKSMGEKAVPIIIKSIKKDISEKNSSEDFMNNIVKSRIRKKIQIIEDIMDKKIIRTEEDYYEDTNETDISPPEKQIIDWWKKREKQ